MKTETKNYKIDKYNKNPNICKNCRKPIVATYNDNLNEVKRKIFCNSSCSAKYNNSHSPNRPRKYIKYCINCGNILNNGIKYCSNKCANEYRYKQYINNWKAGNISGTKNGSWKGISGYIRRYLFEKYNSKCSICGWSKINPFSNSIPLEIEHIDGDATNNKESNLTLLCPNCHSLTSTYRGLNRGKSTRNITWIPNN